MSTSQYIESKLKDRTIELLNNRPVWMLLKHIAQQTQIPEGWIKMLAQNKIAEPSVNRIEKIYEHLSNKPLEV
jgi:hypothetical protein